MDVIRKRLEEIVARVVAEAGAELVELQLKGRPGSQMIKVFVDTGSGITLDKCESISRSLSDALDTEDIIPGRYTLEVSSPGVGRPLHTMDDFRRNLNKNVEVVYKDTERDVVFLGTVLAASEDSVLLQGEREIRRIALSTIQRGKVSLPW